MLSCSVSLPNVNCIHTRVQGTGPYHYMLEPNDFIMDIVCPQVIQSRVVCSKTPWHGSSMVTTPAGCDFGEDSEVPEDQEVVLYHSLSMVDLVVLYRLLSMVRMKNVLPLLSRQAVAKTAAGTVEYNLCALNAVPVTGMDYNLTA